MTENWWSETNETAKAVIIFQGIFVIIMCACNTFLYYIIESSNWTYIYMQSTRGRVNNMESTRGDINLSQ